MNSITPYSSVLISSYPDHSPIEGARHLKIFPTRDSSSIIDSFADRIHSFVQEMLPSYSNESHFNSGTARDILERTKKDAIRELQVLTPDLRRRCISQLEAVISNSDPLFAKGILTKKFYLLLDTIFLHWIDLHALLDGRHINRGPFTHMSESLEKTEASSINGVFYCQHFAFYMLNDSWARDFLFPESSTCWPQEMTLNPLSFFTKQGYQSTQNPLKYDLVVYCSTLKGFLQAKHYGIWLKEDRVLSKKGATNVYEHPLEEVIIGYGNIVYFFHKPLKTEMQRLFYQELEKASSAPYHFANYTPLTTLGSLDRMISFLKSISSSDNNYPGSFFNDEYDRTIQTELVLDLREANTGTTKNELFGHLKELTLLISKKIEPRPYRPELWWNALNFVQVD